MAIYYHSVEGDHKAVYDTAKKWRDKCILDDQSLIWDGEKVWTEHNLSRFRTIFIERPDESGDTFYDKLKKQLANESEHTYMFVIEVLFIYFIYPVKGSTSFETKMRNLEMIASWKGLHFDADAPVFQGLKQGLGSTGTFFNTSRYHELSFIFRIVEYLKNEPFHKRKEILGNEEKLKKVADEMRQKVGKKVQMQNILLHLLLPQFFERIASWGHKHKILNTYSDLLNEPESTDMDKSLLIIREQLQEKYPNERFDFYETPEVVKQWRDTSKKMKSTKTQAPRENSNSSKGLSLPEETDSALSDLVFENRGILVDQVTTAISKGKHIILTGPPGTGKSKLASKICEWYGVESKMVTAASNWSTYETIGGYRPDRDGQLYFSEGIFLECVKNKKNSETQNKWLIIDEINRADIDKAFGSLFSVLAGDKVTLPFESTNGNPITMEPQDGGTPDESNEHTYIVPKDWRIIATMNTIDKASLYEMSYAFMRRFAFIPVGIPSAITSEFISKYLRGWEMEDYPHVDIMRDVWKIINRFRKIGPAIVEDIVRHTQDNDDFTSAIILYVLPQFEGLPVQRIREFITRVVDETEALIDQDQLNDFIQDFFDAGGFE